MYGFCSSNALYSASVLFRMFSFILTPFDTCYNLRLNLSLVLLIKVFLIKKHVPLFLSLPKKRNNFSTWIYFCVYLVFLWSDIVKKVLPKVEVSEKRIKRGDYHIGGCIYGRGEFKPFAHYGPPWKHQKIFGFLMF